MPRLFLVRHGRATGGYGADLDPGLDDLGRAQAAATAERLGPLGPLPMITSPLRRAREPAAALEARFCANIVGMKLSVLISSSTSHCWSVSPAPAASCSRRCRKSSARRPSTSMARCTRPSCWGMVNTYQ